MLNENIKNARKQKRISQEALARELNVVRQTISKWENGLSVPDADMLIKLSKVLNVPVNRLLDIEENHEIDMAKQLAILNEQLANKSRELKMIKKTGKIRGQILTVTLLGIIVSMSVQQESVGIIAFAVCAIASLIILYKNIDILSSLSLCDPKIKILKITTIFDMIIIIAVVALAVLVQWHIVDLGENDGRYVAMVIVSIVIAFSGMVANRLPFNRHTGLRLPWTIRDEDTWNVAHAVLKYTAFPIILLYAAGTIIFHNFEYVTMAVVALWIGIPGIISFVFYYKKR